VDVNWIHVAQVWKKILAAVNRVIKLQDAQMVEFRPSLPAISFLRMALFYAVSYYLTSSNVCKFSSVGNDVVK